MKSRYGILIQWSDEDDCFVVTLPDFADGVMQPCADGSTYEEAAKNAVEVLELLVETYQEEGKPLPEPKTFPHQSLQVA
ncbi:MAG: type II toxin-antitoxin system HicB family antitoxin [Leptolyngbyaceae cyanobacterium RM2_2_4]|nr:type II toxin-antitoxin system HicB family antitoxin [Leptolyngbyaceae cyanobacterium SM1_4_3]NJN89444.1 type II toxin-antitoxin system HicB family antitoxin [Leptolyngbyaceae cyanobacterium SL_5_14]NJO52374.1 type II toxin-antitoxin system HicB family antitoxin [Leptolyngbyaceae cyanobacterium RM2_2_4]NJO67299.1 type II toxin-antitoxin system HicB family antitoxin [Leptolyngbyaceae cyanobacterium RM1_405_57]